MSVSLCSEGTGVSLGIPRFLLCVVHSGDEYMVNIQADRRAYIALHGHAPKSTVERTYEVVKPRQSKLIGGAIRWSSTPGRGL